MTQRQKTVSFIAGAVLLLVAIAGAGTGKTPNGTAPLIYAQMAALQAAPLPAPEPAPAPEPDPKPGPRPRPHRETALDVPEVPLSPPAPKVVPPLAPPAKPAVTKGADGKWHKTDTQGREFVWREPYKFNCSITGGCMTAPGKWIAVDGKKPAPAPVQARIKASGGCANGQCGQKSSGFGFFGRRR